MSHIATDAVGTPTGDGLENGDHFLPELRIRIVELVNIAGKLGQVIAVFLLIVVGVVFDPRMSGAGVVGDKIKKNFDALSMERVDEILKRENATKIWVGVLVIGYGKRRGKAVRPVGDVLTVFFADNDGATIVKDAQKIEAVDTLLAEK